MAKGIFIIDAAGQVTWTNWSDEVADASGLKVVRGRIATVTPNDQKTFNAALEKVLADPRSRVPDPLTIIIKARDGSTRQIIHLVPMRRPAPETKSRVAPAEPPGGAMLFVTDSMEAVSVSPLVLQNHLGLSPSESRIAALVAAGERPRDIAVKLGLTENSTRVILKRVFAKVGVSRQSELVALVSNLTSIPL